MSAAGAPRQLPRAILVRLADLRRHLDALRHAMASFEGDFDLELFAAEVMPKLAKRFPEGQAIIDAATAVA